MVLGLTDQVGAPPQPEMTSASPDSDGGGEADVGDDAPAPRSATPLPADGTAGAEGTQPEPTAPAVEPLARSAPTRLSIPSIGVDDAVFPIGLGEDGELLAPSGDRADLPAWYDGSPSPGETGPSVIEGHVTWRGEPSIFFELGGIEKGQRVSVEREDGITATFEVYDIARYPKDEFPTLDVYGRAEVPELRLITCGGDLDEDGHHLDNTVVFARLVSS